MRPLWKGSISFGLVSIPVKMFAATEHKNIKFRYLHRRCHSPLEYKRVCPKCNVEVEWEEIVRGYEYEPGHFVVMEDSDLENLPDENVKTIDIIDFVRLEEIDPVYFDHSYYLSPAEAGGKPYRLLQQALSDTGMIGVARLTIRSRPSLATIRTFDRLLALETMYYPDEVRDIGAVPGLEQQVSLQEKELKMARELIESLASSFAPEKYKDDYRDALREVIRAKIEGQEISVPEAPQREKVVDLMEALKASVEAARKTKSGGDKAGKVNETARAR